MAAKVEKTRVVFELLQSRQAIGSSAWLMMRNVSNLA
jgi:hypothetical protein